MSEGSQHFWCQTSLVISFGFGDYSLRVRLTENGVYCTHASRNTRYCLLSTVATALHRCTVMSELMGCGPFGVPST